MGDEVVFATPWFELVAKSPDGPGNPHYFISTRDYVLIVARTVDGRLLLVRQHRPAVGRTTLELPAGHVEPGQTPEQAAREELREETGHTAARFELLGNLSPDTGRLGNRMWCFFAADAVPIATVEHRPEEGIVPVLYDGSLRELLAEPEFDSALNLATLLLAVVHGRLPWPRDQR